LDQRSSIAAMARDNRAALGEIHHKIAVVTRDNHPNRTAEIHCAKHYMYLKTKIININNSQLKKPQSPTSQNVKLMQLQALQNAVAISKQNKVNLWKQTKSSAKISHFSSGN
jgi:hypothetical protein